MWGLIPETFCPVYWISKLLLEGKGSVCWALPFLSMELGQGACSLGWMKNMKRQLPDRLLHGRHHTPADYRSCASLPRRTWAQSSHTYFYCIAEKDKVRIQVPYLPMFLITCSWGPKAYARKNSIPSDSRVGNIGNTYIHRFTQVPVEHMDA